MKVNLSVVTNVSEILEDPYMRSDLVKAAFLSAKIVKYLNPREENQRNSRIQQFVQTSIVREVLLSNTLDGDVFGSLVAAYVVEVAKEDDQEKFQNFPVPYSLVEDIVKILFGEEVGEIHGQDTE